jgi:hypothetical protein
MGASPRTFRSVRLWYSPRLQFAGAASPATGAILLVVVDDRADRPPTLLLESQLSHERLEARLRAEGIENPVLFEPQEPLRIGGVRPFKQIHRTCVIAKSQIDQREVERRNLPSDSDLLEGCKLRLRTIAVAGCSVGVSEKCGHKRGRVHGLGLFQGRDGIAKLTGFEIDPTLKGIGRMSCLFACQASAPAEVAPSCVPSLRY